MNRQERRRMAKEVAKGNIQPCKPQSKLVVPAELIDGNGKRYHSVMDYLDAMEKEIAQQCGNIAAQMLYDTEIYIAVSNIIMMLYATEKAVGNLKTVQKSYQKIIDNFNEASEWVDKVGIRKAYEEFRDKYGLQLEFDDADLDWISDQGETIRKKFRLKIGDGKE